MKRVCKESFCINFTKVLELTHVLKEVVNTAMGCFTVNYETLLLSKIFHVHICVTAVNISGTAATSFA